MKRINSPIKDLQIFEPTTFGDERGFFMETFRAEWFPGYSFVQDNHSKSVGGTLRGMHYQLNQPQGKFVRVTDGEVYDVALDLRRSSKTFGQWYGTTLSSENKRLLWVPPGFAHGFMVTSKTAEFQYKCTAYYAPVDEQTIVWNDPALAIDWPLADTAPLLSAKDEQGVAFSDAVYYD
ncbi:MAG: dTDP-4-dehydrorhamnose 3,5-epimerase [Bacteroidia bacterium]|jgi:dTDP-4-dehydrorhamnose 3,5-epimerase